MNTDKEKGMYEDIMKAFTDSQIIAENLICSAFSMKEGQCMFIPKQLFKKAFPESAIGTFIDGRSPEDRFLENLPGTNYGAYKLQRDIITGDLTLSRQPCGKERVREDCDRR